MANFICFKCQRCFENVGKIVEHFKKDHGLPVNYKYLCKQSKCTQAFQNIYRFKSHLNKHLKDNRLQPTQYENEIQRNDIQHQILPHNTNTTLVKENNVIMTNCNSEVCIYDFSSDINKLMIAFLLQLHNNTTVSRKLVLEIQDMITKYITTPIAEIVKNVFESEGNHLLVHQATQTIAKPFSDMDTEYKFLKQLESLNLYKPPTSFCISNTLSEIIMHNNPILAPSTIEISFVDIPFQIKKFFESEGVLQATLHNIQKLKSTKTYSNILNGELWKSFRIDENKLTVPLFLYLDDFEINDPLGSKSGQQKLCGIYYNFPVIPNFQIPRINNIFVAGFIKSRDIKDCGLNSALSPLLDVLRTLQKDGLDIQTGAKQFRLYIQLSQIIGDNLGLNTVLGYVSSFSAQSFCRICKRHKKDTYSDCIEISSSLRNVTNYEADLLCNDPKQTGIKEISVFNTLSQFHVTDNIACDIMHDIYLGVCKYNLSKIVYYFVYKKKFLSLDTLNYRKQMFQYGDTEIANISPPIEKKHILNASFKMNAKQMKTFIHFFTLMVGDLISPNDEVYQFLILFVSLIDKLLLPNFDDKLLIDLQSLITKHNELYQQLFNDTLKPKHHNLVHYPTIIKKLGPLKFLWAFRFEAQHQLHKQYARSITSRINVPITLCKKASLRFADCVQNNNFFQKEFVINNSENIDLQNNLNLAALIEPSEFGFYKRINEVIFRGNTFKIGHVVTLNECQAYEVIDFITKNNEFFIFGRKSNVISFSNHFQAYLIGNSTELYKLINFYDIEGPPTNFYILCNGLKVLRRKKYWK